jgi:2,3-bisphosphoglycerate-independent phosphoglycerate mutase
MCSKVILFIADGMADRPVKELGWRTPLEVANKPRLNQLAEDGTCGIVDPIAPGIPPGSDTSTLALLGYDPMKVYSGRGALEALGIGVEVGPGDVAFRCNFATVDKDMIILDRRAGRIANEDASQLAARLQEVKLVEFPRIRFTFKNAVQHRAVLVLRGTGLSPAVSDSDPESVGKKVLEVEPLDGTKEAKQTARIVNALMGEFHKVLEKDRVNTERVKRKLPAANIVLCRGAGTVPLVSSLQDRFGIKSACIAAVSLIRGVSEVVGMELVNVKGATGTPQTDYMAKAKAAARALKEHDFILLHVKATDVASHDGNAKLKIEVIEKVDKMLGYLLDNVDIESTYIAVTADHTTSLRTRNHEGDPVPLAIVGPEVRRDDVTEFNERTCAKGGLHRIRGMDLMSILMSLIGKTKKFGS